MNNGLYTSQGNSTSTTAVYEGVFRDTAANYYTNAVDNTIEIDYDTITNSNYTRKSNAINVSSSGYYRIYAQCRIETGTQGRGSISVFINNTAYRSLHVIDLKNTTLPTYNISCIANLNASDSVSLHIYAANSSLRIVNTSSEHPSSITSYITIEKL